MTPSYRFPDIQDLLAEIERGGPYASIDDVNRLLTERTSAYNARPQAELGGLSPDQMAALLYGDWKSTGALRLNEDLPLVAFGLLEERAPPGENPWLPIIEYRRTPLFDRFLRFDLRQAVRIDPNGIRLD